MHAAPRRRSPPLVEHRLGATEEVDQGEAGRAREEVALVLQEGVGWEVRADGEQEDREVEERWAARDIRVGVGGGVRDGAGPGRDGGGGGGESDR